MKKLLFLLFLLPTIAMAQSVGLPNDAPQLPSNLYTVLPTGQGVYSGVGAPSGSCSDPQIYVNRSNGDLYSCNSGSWLKAGGAGTSAVSGQANGVIPLGTTATTITQQSHLDDGITTAGIITSTEPIAAPSFKSGTGCVPAGSTAVGGVCMTEATNTGWTPTAAFDYIRGDSTAHAFLCSANNSAEGNCPFQSVTTGNSPPTCTAGTAGVHCMGEGTAPTGAASVDDIYADSTTHALTALNNNTNEGPLLTASRNLIWNANQAAQSQVVVSATEYYIANSNLNMPATYRLAIGAGTTLHWRIALTKTAAGTGSFQILLKEGTNGSTADTTNTTVTIGTQTAAADNMECDITITFTSTTAYYYSVIPRQSAATGTGFGLAYPAAAAQFTGTKTGLTTTTASDKWGISVVFTTGTPTFVVNEVFATANGVL